jgi:hypothetical protein
MTDLSAGAPSIKGLAPTPPGTPPLASVEAIAHPSLGPRTSRATAPRSILPARNTRPQPFARSFLWIGSDNSCSRDQSLSDTARPRVGADAHVANSTRVAAASPAAKSTLQSYYAQCRHDNVASMNFLALCITMNKSRCNASPSSTGAPSKAAHANSSCAFPSLVPKPPRPATSGLRRRV